MDRYKYMKRKHNHVIFHVFLKNKIFYFLKKKFLFFINTCIIFIKKMKKIIFYLIKIN